MNIEGLKQKVLLFFSVIIIIFISLNIGIIVSTEKLKSSSANLHTRNYLPLKNIEKYSKISHEIEYYLASYIAGITESPSVSNLIIKSIPILDKEYSIIVNTTVIDDSKRKSDFNKFKKGHSKYVKLLGILKEHLDNRRRSNISEILNDAWFDIIVDVFEPVDRISDYLASSYGEQVKKMVSY